MPEMREKGGGGGEGKAGRKGTREKESSRRQSFQSHPPALTTEVYALKYMIIRFYGSEPQGPECLSVNNRLQGKARV